MNLQTTEFLDCENLKTYFMFISKVIKSKSGKWFGSPLQFIEEFKLGPKSGIQHGYITIDNPSFYFEFKNRFEQLIESENDGYAVFSESELQNSTSFLLHNFSPAMTYPARLNKDDDGDEYLRYAFGEICLTCNRIPKGEQIKPFTFAREPKLSKKHIWGGIHWTSGYIFTDKERYKILNQRWGLEKREVLIGAKQKISNSFVQIEVPISNSPLCFGNSDFGNTFRMDEIGGIDNTIHKCPECIRPLYTNQVLDYFPSFIYNEDRDIVFTQEWFEYFRRLVISRKFADWLIENKYLSWDYHFLIPVKDFCNKNDR